MNSPYIQKVEGTLFNLLMVDNWLVGLFRTNNDIWRFVEYLSEQLAAGEPVPQEIYVVTLAGPNQWRWKNRIQGYVAGPSDILEMARIVRMTLKLPSNDENARETDYLVYTALHDSPEAEKVRVMVKEYFPQILMALYEEKEEPWQLSR
jgi:hypothetical protein